MAICISALPGQGVNHARCTILNIFHSKKNTHGSVLWLKKKKMPC